MRSEQEMMDLILTYAKKDDRIRAVYMNGSRTNPRIQSDIFQDYDIVYVVKETATFIRDATWIRVFGELFMLQEPDKLDQGRSLEVNFERTYAYLMLFNDGNRLDLRLQTIEATLSEYGEDKLTIPLLDKDQLLPTIGPPSDADYHVKEPSVGEFTSCVNNFWWCLQNVAKGIWRDELPYAKLMFEYTTRHTLDEMVSWWIGINTDFELSIGKLGKYIKRYLPEAYWVMYKETYSDASYDTMWKSIFKACELFRILAIDVAEKLGFNFPQDDDKNMTKYLNRVRHLPTDANKFF
ncbi:aminoglycoside 6-adenylyltransferase [Shouchella patagoniensis]|uniref:aminoglycoside 6-adenylyltransferase n=1 Tax=Shouchella patagoniensis TaxID=228576 RepID=UPI0009954740|nr:aminoglycoside 6-adenylyltransferase [Shouchella patagoniensis]